MCKLMKNEDVVDTMVKLIISVEDAPIEVFDDVDEALKYAKSTMHVRIAES